MTLWQSMTHSVLGAAMSTFGETVTLRPGKEFHQELRAIFRAAHAQVDLGQGGISTVEPELDVRIADVRDHPPKQGEEVIVRGLRYRISDTQPDGEGGLKCKLKRLEITP